MFCDDGGGCFLVFLSLLFSLPIRSETNTLEQSLFGVKADLLQTCSMPPVHCWPLYQVLIRILSQTTSFHKIHLQTLQLLYFLISAITPPHFFCVAFDDNFWTIVTYFGPTLGLISVIPDRPIGEMKLTCLLSIHWAYKTLLQGSYFQSQLPLSDFFERFITSLSHPFCGGHTFPFQRIEKSDLSKMPNSGQVYLLSACTTLYPPGSCLIPLSMMEFTTTLCVIGSNLISTGTSKLDLPLPW